MQYGCQYILITGWRRGVPAGKSGCEKWESANAVREKYPAEERKMQQFTGKAVSRRGLGGAAGNDARGGEHRL